MPSDLPELSNNDLLESLIRRSMMPGASVGGIPTDTPTDVTGQDDTEPGVKPGSLLAQFEQWRKKKKPDEGDLNLPVQPLQQFGAGAGMLAPGIGGLGGVGSANPAAYPPTNPLDPNYAPPASTASQLQDLVRPSTSTPDQVPLPVARPIGADLPGPTSAAAAADAAKRADQATDTAPVSDRSAARPATTRGPDGQPDVPPTDRPPSQVGGRPLIMGGADQAGMLPSLGGIGDWLRSHSNTLLSLGAGFAGAPNIGQGISRASAAAIPGQQADIQQQLQMGNQAAAYNALVSAGVPQDLARVGATNSDVMKQLMQTYLMPHRPELKEITLPNGNKMSVLHDPISNTITDLQGRALEGNAPGAIDPSLTGQDAADAAKKADPQTYAHAMSLVEGRERWPVGRAMTMPGMKQAVDLARQIDPSLTDANAGLRYQTTLDYGPKGKIGATRLALSNMMGHAEQLDQLNKIVGNWDVGGERANQARQALKNMMGTDKTYLDAKAQADVLRHLLAGEANMAFAGSHAVSGTREFLDELGKNTGTTAQHGAVKGLVHAAGTRLGELQSQFDSAMNTRSEGYHMLSPRAQKIFQKWEGDSSGMDFSAKAPSALPQGADDPGAFATPSVAGVKPKAGALPQMSSTAEASKLPSGTHFLDPNGVERIRP